MADEHDDDDSELLLDTPLDEADDDEAPPEGAEDEAATSEDDGDDDEVEYAIGDEPAPSGRGDDSSLVKHLRQVTKEQARKLAELERQIPKAPPIEVGEKPKFDDYWDDPEKFESDLLAWNERSREAADQQAEQRKQLEQVQEEGRKVVEGYEQQKKTLNRPDYDDAEANVFGKLQPEKVALLLQGSDNAAQTIHALHRFPDKLQELVKLSPAKFAFAAGKLEGQLKVMPKRKAPPPEEIARGNASASGGDKELARLEAKADKTGDRSELAAYRARNKEKAK